MFVVPLPSLKLFTFKRGKAMGIDSRHTDKSQELMIRTAMLHFHVIFPFTTSAMKMSGIKILDLRC